MFGIHRNFPDGGGGVDVNDYLAYRMNFGSTAAMSISSEDWVFDNGITIVGQLTKVTHAGNFSRVLFGAENGAGGIVQLRTISSDDANPERRGSLSLFVNDNGGTSLCSIFSDSSVIDGNLHNFLISYDPDAGAAHLWVDDAEEENDTATGRALTTGTINSGAGRKIFGARESGTPDRYWGDTGGSCGYFGIANTVIDFSVTANRRKFFDAAGLAIKPDESGWTQFGGVTPYCWHPTGDLRNNRGSKSDFTDDSTTAANLIAVA